ncbi:MAG: cysteate synthase [Candidatus Methanoplasma sp.]|jgi:cysteate synthase|nr:cysteate synthase [Candidatus Methanoplasma sp.]
MGEHAVRCPKCGRAVDTHSLSCPAGCPALLRTEYVAKRLTERDLPGMFRFFDWLPVRSVLNSRSSPVAFRSKGVSKELGLKDLWIGFTGYYPERNAFSVSCTFKETEALPTFARLKDRGGGRIVVASAGNTGRAFAQTAGDTDSDCLVVVPDKAADRIEVSEDRGRARLLTVRGDYADAIRVAERIASFGGFVPEGGARNVARRDGMGTVLLEGALRMGSLPDHYFQGVGSGTGGISAWEASLRLVGDGRFGDRLPKLHLAQNIPFTPMADAWNAGRRDIIEKDLSNGTDIYADVLANRTPPYGISGGVFDAMTACDGEFLTVTEKSAREAEKLWNIHENAALDPAAAVALAALTAAVEDGLPLDEKIFLNITGGGRDRVKEDIALTRIEPSERVNRDVSDADLRRAADA